MSRLDRLLAAKNAWSQPPFWATDSLTWWGGLTGEKETIGDDFVAYVGQAYNLSSPIFATILARLMVLSEARFLWQEMVEGRPGKLFHNRDLTVLEEPWENGDTGAVIAHMEQDASLAGNGYMALVTIDERSRLRRLRPDWTTILTLSPTDDPYHPMARLGAYIYEPKAGHNREKTIFTPAQVAHYKPIPDPEAQWRGMSWLRPARGEIEADLAATKHKRRYFENGATLGTVISYDKSLQPEQVKAYAELFDEQHRGADKAYRTLHIGGGADPKVIGSPLHDSELKAIQAASETRIGMPAGVHPVIVGMSEGLAGSSLNAGNFAAARRRFADGTCRPLWRSLASALQSILPRPENARLWYDPRDVAFLRDDEDQEAEIRLKDAQTMRQLIEAGFAQETVAPAVMAGDWSLLRHSGLFSVQLQPPGSTEAMAIDARAAVDLLARGWTFPSIPGDAA